MFFVFAEAFFQSSFCSALSDALSITIALAGLQEPSCLDKGFTSTTKQISFRLLYIRRHYYCMYTGAADT